MSDDSAPLEVTFKQAQKEELSRQMVPKVDKKKKRKPKKYKTKLQDQEFDLSCTQSEVNLFDSVPVENNKESSQETGSRGLDLQIQITRDQIKNMQKHAELKA